jgi:hypothetical protein
MEIVRANSWHLLLKRCQLRHTWRMSGFLQVGSIVVAELKDGIRRELLSAFSEDMFERVTEPWDEVYDNVIARFRAPGRHIAERLDLIGISRAAVLRLLDRSIHGTHADSILDDYEERVFLDGQDNFSYSAEAIDALIKDNDRLLRSLDAESWVLRLSSAPLDAGVEDMSPASKRWLMRFLKGWDEIHTLRITLLAFPDAEVTLDVTDLLAGRWGHDDRKALIARVQEVASGAALPPLIVLTEGRTDAEFIAAAVNTLYPHLADLIRFPDFGLKPEGGVPALVRNVKAFAAAGVANRTVAVLDNDTAGAEGFKLVGSSLPANIHVMRYPDLSLARSYPTLGPPTLDSPDGSLAFADVNGLAGGIELYLGRDVLQSEEGHLRPVQWKSYINGLRRYQGEVMGKEEIHAAFRAKVEEAQRDPQAVQRQDWERPAHDCQRDHFLVRPRNTKTERVGTSAHRHSLNDQCELQGSASSQARTVASTLTADRGWCQQAAARRRWETRSAP